MRLFGILILTLMLMGCATVVSQENSAAPSVQEISHAITADDHLQTDFILHGWHVHLAETQKDVLCEGEAMMPDQFCSGTLMTVRVFHANASNHALIQAYIVTSNEGHMPQSGEDVLMINVLKQP